MLKSVDLTGSRHSENMELAANQKVIAPVMIVVYLTAIAVMLMIVLLRAPHFSYTLDDPYIHLALAQNIAIGHYGINPGETTSPSSSVLWPFLLAPLSRTIVAEWVPLFLNMVFSLGTCILLARWLEPRLRSAGFGNPSIAGLAICLVLAANMPGLTMTGMEHSLQVLLVVACVIAIFRVYEGGSVAWPYLAAAALAPAVRYENVVYTGAVCAALLLKRRYGIAVTVFVVSILPLVGLGLFLHAHGLPPFPNSVMAKGGMEASSGRSTGLTHLIGLVAVNAKNLFVRPSRRIIFLCLLAIATCCVYLRRRYTMWPMMAVLLAAVAMVLVGPYDWYFRYDVALRIFVLLLALGLTLHAMKGQKLLAPVIWLLTLLSAVAFLPPLLGSPGASLQIARQQYEMHRFLQQVGSENVAVNDLGWVSFNAYGKFYVLDLIGLANLETLREKKRDTAWLDRVTKKHDVELVMIYDSWFASPPPDWIKLGVLHESQQYFESPISTIGVSFYATSTDAAKRLLPQLGAFRRTLPSHAWIQAK
ncbi:hypothetical protein [Terriglobus roseus]|uniref:Glycosyltransferase RgtA/B/C/D-like domain-containing protein n=1 Tax=Terriglobus roseus TaxID=392734 RepID=A0A1G7JK89_9BACT|nr:hypothetical protein [Terriglobus roseus]SDF25341.1 hypothetical protein SAMN05444167_1852 [Terriglobus roseus]